MHRRKKRLTMGAPALPRYAVPESNSRARPVAGRDERFYSLAARASNLRAKRTAAGPPVPAAGTEAAPNAGTRVEAFSSVPRPGAPARKLLSTHRRRASPPVPNPPLFRSPA